MAHTYRGDKRYFKCCICEDIFEGMGNNPHPLIFDDEDDECCDNCNWTKVMPARIKEIQNAQL